MAGLHFSCGDWMGDDKGADALLDVIQKGLDAFVTKEEKAAWRKQFLVPFVRQTRRAAQAQAGDDAGHCRGRKRGRELNITFSYFVLSTPDPFLHPEVHINS